MKVNPLTSAFFANLIAIVSLGLGLYTYFVTRQDALKNQRTAAFVELVGTGVFDETTVVQDVIANPKYFNTKIAPILVNIQSLGPPSVSETIDPMTNALQGTFNRDQYYSAKHRLMDAFLAATKR